jgi:quercetin dioxygenase-like cupin family protein
MVLSTSSASPRPFVLTPNDYQPPLNVLGIRVTVLATNVATQSYEVTLQQGDEGMGPPPHSHRWDESFYVLKGSVEFTCAAETAICGPGTLVHVPAHTVHAFRFGEHGGEMLEMSGQGGLATQMFTAVNDEIPAGPPDISKVVRVLKQNGVTVSV